MSLMAAEFQRPRRTTTGTMGAAVDRRRHARRLSTTMSPRIGIIVRIIVHAPPLPPPPSVWIRRMTEGAARASSSQRRTIAQSVAKFAAGGVWGEGRRGKMDCVDRILGGSGCGCGGRQGRERWWRNRDARCCRRRLSSHSFRSFVVVVIVVVVIGQEGQRAVVVAPYGNDGGGAAVTERSLSRTMEGAVRVSSSRRRTIAQSVASWRQEEWGGGVLLGIPLTNTQQSNCVSDCRQGGEISGPTRSRGAGVGKQ